jgi:hypothetical protein
MPPDPDDDRLRDLLRTRVRAATKEALEAEGLVPAEQIKRLEDLARLMQIADAAHPPPRRRFWPLVAALAGALLVVSALLFVRVRETEIELDLAVGEVGFVVSTEQVLTNLVDLTAFSVSGLRRVHLPPMAGEPAETPVLDSGLASTVQVTAVSDQKNPGAISLDALTVPAGTRVWIERSSMHQHRLSLEGKDLALKAAVRGRLRIAMNGMPSHERHYAAPRPVLMQASSGVIDVDLTIADPSQPEFSPQLLASDLSFSRIEEFRTQDRTLIRPLSTILSGTLFLEALDGRRQEVRPGEALRFEQSEGLIRTLALDPRNTHIAVKFRGRVRGMRVGWSDAQRSLMPSQLEWLQARHGFYLLWGSTLYLFGLVASLLRWWGVRV